MFTDTMFHVWQYKFMNKSEKAKTIMVKEKKKKEAIPAKKVLHPSASCRNFVANV